MSLNSSTASYLVKSGTWSLQAKIRRWLDTAVHCDSLHLPGCPSDFFLEWRFLSLTLIQISANPSSLDVTKTAYKHHNIKCSSENSLRFYYTRTSGRSAPLVLVPVPPSHSHNPSCLSQPRMLVTINHVSHNPSSWSHPPMLVTNPYVSHNPSC